MKRKRKAFVKVLEKLSWFLLILGLGLILACRSWSQIRVSGLGRDMDDHYGRIEDELISCYPISCPFVQRVVQDIDVIYSSFT